MKAPDMLLPQDPGCLRYLLCRAIVNLGQRCRCHADTSLQCDSMRTFKYLTAPLWHRAGRNSTTCTVTECSSLTAVQQQQRSSWASNCHDVSLHNMTNAGSQWQQRNVSRHCCLVFRQESLCTSFTQLRWYVISSRKAATLLLLKWRIRLRMHHHCVSWIWLTVYYCHVVY